MIRAIETRYAGCLFRSRLEARWAVFFDALGIAWEYEPQGFETPHGRYLPDFHLPERKRWVEIKGPPPSRNDFDRGAWFARQLAGYGEAYRMLVGDIPRRAAPGGIPALAYTPNGFKQMNWVPLARGSRQTLAVIDTALSAARSARFEWGSSGAQ